MRLKIMARDHVRYAIKDATPWLMHTYEHAAAEMDFWSRLVGGAGASAASSQTKLNGPQQRLTNFKHLCLKLQQLWQKKGANRSDPAVVSILSSHLQSINRILRDETLAAAPHLCVQYVATAQIHLLMSSIGSTVRSTQIMKEAVRFFDLLIDREEEDFIEDVVFADRLLSLTRGPSDASTGLDTDTETELVELLFAVTAKLRQRPAIPSAWFRPSKFTNNASSPSATNLEARTQEFPLVYLLLDYVHHKGKVGDFARTGLLYIFESAARSHELEKWVIESELATIMASGLGALYSQLSSKVALGFAKESVPPILGFSNISNLDHSFDAEPVFSNTLRTNVATFLSYLVFWQDILERCPSVDIKATLLDHFDFLFLRPLLYPSLVESSDIDSGSSVAVLTYLRYVFETVDHPDIIRLLLQYMLGATAEVTKESTPSRPTALARRRKSESLVILSANRLDEPSPDLLTLTHVMHGYLLSRNQQTVTSSLRLLATIMRLRHDYVATTVIRVQATKRIGSKRTLQAHDRDLEILYSLAEGLLEDDGLEGYYESHLQDAQSMIERHPCSARRLFPPSTDASETMFLHKTHGPTQQYAVVPDDPIFTCLLALLDDFLVNDVEVNLSLSEILAILASCGGLSLESWLVGPNSKDSPGASSDHEVKPLDGSLVGTRVAENRSGVASPVFARLNSLAERVDELRQDIQDFDIYLAERRHIFKVGEDIDDALAITSIQQSGVSKDSKQSRTREQAYVGSIAERLKASSNASRSSSPRGRQQDHTRDRQAQPKSLVGRLSHLRLSPPPSPSKSLERTYSPSPLRKGSISSTTSSTMSSPRGPPDVLERRVRLKANTKHRGWLRESTDSETSSIRSESIKAGTDDAEDTKEISLSQLLTNIVILQEFILELAAMIQARASLFGEVSLL
ncbi:MAG: hypothetical protein Q9181_003310 [Wetmoreana brouardii]